MHKLRNVVAKLPKRSGLHEEIKAKFWAALDDATDPADAERRLRELVAELARPYPSAAACLAEDLPALCIHLNYFPRLRKRFRSSNLLERSLEEVKRRSEMVSGGRRNHVIRRRPQRGTAIAVAGVAAQQQHKF